MRLDHELVNSCIIELIILILLVSNSHLRLNSFLLFIFLGKIRETMLLSILLFSWGIWLLRLTAALLVSFHMYLLLGAAAVRLGLLLSIKLFLGGSDSCI